MKVCILRGAGVDQKVIDGAIRAMKARKVDAGEVRREAPSGTMARSLKDSDLLLTLGGDGTFLAGARLAAPRGIPILGVNHGRLGFLTEIEAGEMNSGLRRYLDGRYRIEERTMLQVTLLRGRRSLAQSIGLNEVVVDHAGDARILRLEIDVADQAVGTIDADGAIVATEPTLEDLVLVPMSPFALTVRPIVFGPRRDITLTVVRGPAEMRVDGGRRGRAVATGDVIRCGPHARKLKVVRFSPPESFYQRLGDKLGWGRPLVPKK